MANNTQSLPSNSSSENEQTLSADMTLVDFKMMSIESLRVFLALRNKPTEGDLETLVYRSMAAWEEKVPVNLEAEETHRINLSEYKKKLIVKGQALPDPLSLTKKDWTSETNGGLTNWPAVYYSDIAKYLELLNTPQDLLHRLDCEYKEGKGFRYFSCEFVKEIFYSDFKKTEYCVLKCKVTPSQRTSLTPYNVWCILKKENPGGEIISAYCSCTAGLLGSCNHVIAMLFRVEAAVSSGVTKPTCTSKLCEWNVPKTTKNILEIKPIRDITFVKDHYKKRSHREEATVTKKKFLAFSPSYESQVLELKNADVIRGKLYNSVKNFAPKSRFVELMENKKKSVVVIENDDQCLPESILETANSFMWEENLGETENIKKFTAEINISNEQIKTIYNLTKDQSNSKVWFDQRKGRMTASKFHRVHTRVNTLKKETLGSQNLDSLFGSILGNTKFESVATKHGIAMEPHAKEAVIKILKKTHKKFTSTDPGMTVSDMHPFLSVSPDVETFCECCKEGVIEIKCPYSICESKPTVENLPYLEKIGDKVLLKKNHQYYTQIQGQLAITKRKIAWFFIYTHHGNYLEVIKFDQTHWQNILDNMIYFWENHLALKIIEQVNTPQVNVITPNQNSKKNNTPNVNTLIVNTPIAGIQKIKPKVKKIKKQPKKKAILLMYLCNVCHNDCEHNPTIFAENSIACTKCKRWFHFSCINITTEAQIPKTNQRWHCSLCK